MDVKVKAAPSTGAIEWTIDGKKPRESMIRVAKGGGTATLDFKLDDRTGLGLRFDQADPIWVHEDENEEGGCPAAGIDTDQIGVRSCDDRRLSILNANSGPERILHYQLNFVDSRGNRIRVDPIIKNGGSV